ncbi:hypothetical protein M422DRAFT_255123 [Sphaerobolus stellatus SS14]|uniref:Uncharacterized protein n=1 Tax=Sphaerobolus stellatus (strain SS14) TaxID=990650 RepID=A0A0C9UFM0_SPHS4|nr:hypothetical protein M422DRAFT_255123 [Sphaerobolus stellatus SS14]
MPKSLQAFPQPNVYQEGQPSPTCIQGPGLEPSAHMVLVMLSHINLEPGIHKNRITAEVRTFFKDYEQLKAYINKHHDNITLPPGTPAMTGVYITALCNTIVTKGIKVLSMSSKTLLIEGGRMKTELQQLKAYTASKPILAYGMVGGEHTWKNLNTPTCKGQATHR